mmetsp:Transcript_46170/g.147508  ORF Transcript_46170/g.147508 Transcript_46170/m.147508 type:complete len:206 (+) Transcript_46170:69-686(+)
MSSDGRHGGYPPRCEARLGGVPHSESRVPLGWPGSGDEKSIQEVDLSAGSLSMSSSGTSGVSSMNVEPMPWPEQGTLKAIDRCAEGRLQVCLSDGHKQVDASIAEPKRVAHRSKTKKMAATAATFSILQVHLTDAWEEKVDALGIPWSAGAVPKIPSPCCHGEGPLRQAAPARAGACSWFCCANSVTGTEGEILDGPLAGPRKRE